MNLKWSKIRVVGSRGPILSQANKWSYLNLGWSKIGVVGVLYQIRQKSNHIWISGDQELGAYIKQIRQKSDQLWICCGQEWVKILVKVDVQYTRLSCIQ